MVAPMDLPFFIHSMLPFMERNIEFATGAIKDKEEDLRLWEDLSRKMGSEPNQHKIEYMRMQWYRRVEWALDGNNTSTLCSRILRMFGNCAIYEPIFLNELALRPIINTRFQVKQESSSKNFRKGGKSSDSEIDLDSDDDKQVERGRPIKKCASSTNISVEPITAYNMSKEPSTNVKPTLPVASFANLISDHEEKRLCKKRRNELACVPAASSTPAALTVAVPLSSSIASPVTPIASHNHVTAMPSTSTPLGVTTSSPSSVCNGNLEMEKKFLELQSRLTKNFKNELKQNRELMEMEILKVEDRIRQELVKTTTQIYRMLEGVLQQLNKIGETLDDIKESRF